MFGYEYMLRSFSAALASPLSAHPTNQDHVAPAQGDRATPPARQIGIRQRSLRKHCRLGRATELVFITALGAAVTIGGGAAAQSVTYTNGQNRTDTLDTTGGIVLTVNAGKAPRNRAWCQAGALLRSKAQAG